VAFENPSEREFLSRTFEPGTDCPSIEALELFLDDDPTLRAMATHFESCPHCRTELELLRTFRTPPRDEAEAEAVRQVTTRLRSRASEITGVQGRPGESGEPWWKGLFDWRRLRPAALAMAGILIVIAAGMQWRHSAAPGLRGPVQPEQEVLRSGTLRVISPSGDISAPPSQVQWEPAPGAVRYQVRLLEVDHTQLWSAVSSQPRVDLPAEALQKIVPAKTLLLQITAMDESAHTVADSGMVRFRFLQNVHSR
jgi:hypothetical protein